MPLSTRQAPVERYGTMRKQVLHALLDVWMCKSNAVFDVEEMIYLNWFGRAARLNKRIYFFSAENLNCQSYVVFRHRLKREPITALGFN